METGKIIKGRYRVLEKISSGGMADVYLGYDITLDRRVAVKVMHSKLAQEENFVSRFRREAQAAANLNHPNIVSVYDWGEENGTYFIVMEYIEGDTLKYLVSKKGALEVPFAIDITKQVARALSFAHKNDVVHRDIKPQNIIITHDGMVKVMDFGIARAKSSSLTDTGTVMGSVHYLSPEQAQGLPATEVSDIYSLGVIMYEMLTGNIPFEGDSAVSVALKHANETPAKPSAFNPSIPAELEAIILKAIAKDPFDRYQSADELIADLKRLEEGRTVEALGKSYEKTVVLKPSELKLPKRRASLWAIVASLLVLLFLGSAVAALWYYQAKVVASMTEVPKLIDVSLEQAKKLAEEKDLKLVVEKEEHSSIYKAGKIISQKPDPGTKVKKGSTIRVVVSKGEAPVEVPDLIGKSELEAGQILGELGLRIGDVNYENSDKIPADAILKQSPKPKTMVTKGSVVNITISKGVEVVIVPDVEGLTLEKAKEALSKVGLKYRVSEEESNTVEKGKVIRQSPPASDTLKKGETVLLVVSKGPSIVTVPNVVGEDSLNARQKLENLGLTVDIQYVEVLEEEQVGKVLQQSPEANQKVVVGSSVTIWVGQ